MRHTHNCGSEEFIRREQRLGRAVDMVAKIYSWGTALFLTFLVLVTIFSRSGLNLIVVMDAISLLVIILLTYHLPRFYKYFGGSCPSCGSTRFEMRRKKVVLNGDPHGKPVERYVTICKDCGYIYIPKRSGKKTTG